MASSMPILALGAESAGNFAVYSKGKIYHSRDFGDLLKEKNFQKFKKAVLDFIKKNGLEPKIILSDLHPLFKTTLWANELARKFKAKHIQIQHHLAHIFSAIGEDLAKDYTKIQRSQKNGIIFGITCDGTGYGLDGKIWGGEIFQLRVTSYGLRVTRIGHLENQTMIGGELAIKEPARMLIATLAKFLEKEKVYQCAKKYYSRNKFELLYNQFQQNFNCQETSSTGRILDAISLLLGFCQNKRNYKHEPIDLLERNSTIPYAGLKPIVIKSEIRNPKSETNSKFKILNSKFILKTTPLFEYLIKNINKDKGCLAATAQLYIAQGLYKISQISNLKSQIFFAGGIANNKIISSYLESKGVITNKTTPRGDAGISFGQIIYCLLANPRN